MHGCSIIIVYCRNVRSTYAIITLVYNSNSNCRRDAESMSFQNKFAEKAKQYLGEDLDEKIVSDGHFNIIYLYLNELKRKVAKVKNPNYSIIEYGTESTFVIENVTLRTKVNTDNNTIEISKIDDEEKTSLDTIVVQDGELFAVGRNEKFTTEVFEEYLREAFGEKLGL